MTTPKISLRGPRADDLGFLMKSWLKSLGLSRTRYDKDQGYWDAQKEVISRLFERSRIVVACGAEACKCHPADPARHIVGYGVGELATTETGTEAVVHWIYVRDDDRHKGVARAILARLRTGAGVDMTITTCTRDWIRALADKHYWRISEFAPLYSTIEQLRKAG